MNSCKWGEALAHEKGQYQTYNLWTSQTNAILPTYELIVPFFNNSTPKELIRFCRGLAAVRKGQNVTSASSSYTVTKTLLKGKALTAFKKANITYVFVNMENFKKCSDDVTISVFPQKLEQRQERYMCHGLHKDRATPIKLGLDA